MRMMPCATPCECVCTHLRMWMAGVTNNLVRVQGGLWLNRTRK